MALMLKVQPWHVDQVPADTKDSRSVSRIHALGKDTEKAFPNRQFVGRNNVQVRVTMSQD